MNDAHVVCTACSTAFTDVNYDILFEGFWPGSASRRPVYLFQQDLFRFFMLLRLQNPDVSYSGFLRTLEEFSRQKGRVSTYNWLITLFKDLFALTHIIMSTFLSTLTTVRANKQSRKIACIVCFDLSQLMRFLKSTKSRSLKWLETCNLSALLLMNMLKLIVG